MQYRTKNANIDISSSCKTCLVCRPGTLQQRILGGITREPISGESRATESFFVFEKKHIISSWLKNCNSMFNNCPFSKSLSSSSLLHRPLTPCCIVAWWPSGWPPLWTRCLLSAGASWLDSPSETLFLGKCLHLVKIKKNSTVSMTPRSKNLINERLKHLVQLTLLKNLKKWWPLWCWWLL